MPFFKRDPFAKFGPFASALRGSETEIPAYLILLNLKGDDAISALRVVRNAVQSPRWRRFAVRLLREPSWYPHLVGGTALLFEASDEVAEQLWSAIDGGSWVAPQLVVCAYYSDRAFIQRAKTRVEALCPVQEPEGLTALERHVSTGPAGSMGRVAKNLASLIAICERIPGLEIWVREMRMRPDIQESLEYDASTDDSGDIALGWLQRINECFAAEGWPLEPAYQTDR